MNIQNRKKTTNGFVALIGAIIISAILLSLSLSASAEQFSARFDALDSESKQNSLALAKSCAHVALLRIAENFSYAPVSSGDVLSVGDETCMIFSITYSSENTAHEKTADILTRGIWNSTWSTWETKAVIRDPAFPHDTSLPNMSVQSEKEM